MSSPRDFEHVPPLTAEELSLHLQKVLPMNVEIHDRILATFADLDRRLRVIERRIQDPWADAKPDPIIRCPHDPPSTPAVEIHIEEGAADNSVWFKMDGAIVRVTPGWEEEPDMAVRKAEAIARKLVATVSR